MWNNAKTIRPPLVMMLVRGNRNKPVPTLWEIWPLWSQMPPPPPIMHIHYVQQTCPEIICRWCRGVVVAGGTLCPLYHSRMPNDMRMSINNRQHPCPKYIFVDGWLWNPPFGWMIEATAMLAPPTAHAWRVPLLKHKSVKLSSSSTSYGTHLENRSTEHESH